MLCLQLGILGAVASGSSVQVSARLGPGQNVDGDVLSNRITNASFYSEAVPLAVPHRRSHAILCREYRPPPAMSGNIANEGHLMPHDGHAVTAESRQ